MGGIGRGGEMKNLKKRKEKTEEKKFLDEVTQRLDVTI